ncbi:MAG: serine--tRNA ligase [Spirochaetia bacterium]
MLDLKYIKEHAEEVRENIRNRFMNLDVDSVLSLYDKRNSLLRTLEDLRKQRNENAKKMKGKLGEDERSLLIEEGKKLKERISALEEEYGEVDTTLRSEAGKIPNMAHPEAPVGKEEKDNLELHRYGDPSTFSFVPKDHVEIGKSLDLIDFDTAAKVTGQKFYYLKNQAVFLELALARYALDILLSRGFTPTITPDLAREEIVEGIGFNPRGEESNIYNIEDTDSCLVGTAEITLGGYHAGELLSQEQLPIKMAGLSHCFRREAGAAGRFSKGLYRVHQFTKVEMFVYCLPEESENIHQELLKIEEEIFQGLEIPYRVVDTCTGDLGAPAYRKFDLEAWMPGRGENGDWGEVTSASNCTDYQARRLGIRYKSEAGNRHVHMLNGTAVAVSRALIALLENHQREDGSIELPDSLAGYTGFKRIPPAY